MLIKFKIGHEMVSVQGVIPKTEKIAKGDIKVKMFANSIQFCLLQVNLEIELNEPSIVQRVEVAIVEPEEV